MNEIKKVILREDWKYLVKNFLPVNFADSLSFIEAMHLVGNLTKAAADIITEDGSMADLMRDFAVNLMIILRAKYPKEWEEDWKNEAFLGISCAFVYREEEAFIFIKNAYQKLENPPQSLIFAYISAGDTCDSFLNEKEIKELSESAVKKGITYESALRMASIFRDEGDHEKCSYWEDKAEEAEKNKLHTPFITPNSLKGMFDLEEGYCYED